MKRSRKPRTTGSDLGFDGGHMFGREADTDTIAFNKLQDRLHRGLCIGCGEKECKCQSTEPDWKK